MNFEAVVNFREMGGLPAADGGSVRPGRLFRSGNWSQATDTDIRTLADLDLATIVDFRTDTDREADGGPNRIPGEPRYVKLEVVDVDGIGHELRTTLLSGDQALLNERFGNGRAAKLAAEFQVDLALQPDKQGVFARFLSEVGEAGGRPVMWHCSAGKDRAGWAATVLGIALGVPDDALIEHYLASNIHRPVESRLAYYAERGIDAEIMRPFLMVHEEYLRAALAAIDDGWTDRLTYLDTELGFGPEQVDRLRSQLII